MTRHSTGLVEHSTGLVDQTDGARAELGTITFEGQEYAALGAVLADDRIVVYLNGEDRYRGARGEACTWEGKTVGTYEITGRWATPRSYVSSHWISARVTLTDGRIYQGRGAGSGVVWFGRRVATQRRTV